MTDHSHPLREEWDTAEHARKGRQAQVEAARDKYKITQQGANLNTIYVNAECGTGSRYAVTVTSLPYIAALQEGGTHLITVLQPWQTSVVFQLMPGERISEDYIITKLLPRNRDASKVHGGDLFGLVETVNRAAEHWHSVTGIAKKNNRESILREG
jgi:hypothetical protein